MNQKEGSQMEKLRTDKIVVKSKPLNNNPDIVRTPAQTTEYKLQILQMPLIPLITSQ